MDANRLTLDEHWLERLNRQTVKSRSAVQQDWMPFSYLFENIPDLWRLALNHLFSATDGVHVSELLEPPNNERLKQNERHLLRQTALVKLQLRTDHDHRTARVVDSFSKQVLAESATLPFEHVAQRLQGAISCAGYGPAVPAVIEQCVDGFLKHPFFVPDDDIRGLQLQKILQTIVSVYHPAIQIIEIRSGKAATFQRNEGSQIGRNYRQDIQNHPLRSGMRIHKPLNKF